MNLQLEGKTAIVTGGTAGIGHGIATQLADEGAVVWITGRNRPKLDAALSSSNMRGVLADVSTREGATALLKQVSTADILVNNLGTYEQKQFADITDDDWLRLFQINVMSGVRLVRQYLSGMLERNWGRVIFVSSESAVNIPPEMIHYGMTKAAQLAISRGLAETTKGTGVTVNTVLPGPTRSEGIVGFLESLASQPGATEADAVAEFFEKYRPSSLLQRLIDPKEVGYLVAFLASPLSAATNGAALRVEGGLLRGIT
jgi:NAD(P)-dependent dehydrogenase (short-subunit alcohol dehydrogenase family)